MDVRPLTDFYYRNRLSSSGALTARLIRRVHIMATESGYSNKRWAINGSAENIKGWRHLCRLACMEGDLTVMAPDTGNV